MSMFGKSNQTLSSSPAETKTQTPQTMTYDELLAAKTEIDKEIAARGIDQIDELKRKLRMACDAMGIPHVELGEVHSGKKERKKRESKVKYRNSDNPEEVWSGRGRPAKWLQDKLDAGGTKEQFLVA